MAYDFFGNEFVLAIFFIIAATIFSYLLVYLIKKYVYRVALKTKTDLDDKLLKISIRPINQIIIFVGVYLALRSLSLIQPYTNWINNVFYVLFVLIITNLVSKVVGLLIDRMFKKKRNSEKTPKLMYRIVIVIVYLIAILMILGHFNVEITPLIATLGIGGLAVGLALQNTLSNLFAGLHIISDKPVDVDDFIEIDGGMSGYVEDIGWRSTRIRTLPNTIVIVPNSKLAESTIINNSMPQKEMSTIVQVGVAYNSDLDKVERVTVDVARNIQKIMDGAISDFEPFIRYHTFGDSNINFSVILRVKTFVDKYLVTHEFIKALKKRYDKEKIEISWPVRKVFQGK